MQSFRNKSFGSCVRSLTLFAHVSDPLKGRAKHPNRNLSGGCRGKGGVGDKGYVEIYRRSWEFVMLKTGMPADDLALLYFNFLERELFEL